MGKKFAGSALHKGGKTGHGKRRHTRHAWTQVIAIWLVILVSFHTLPVHTLADEVLPGLSPVMQPKESPPQEGAQPAPSVDGSVSAAPETTATQETSADPGTTETPSGPETPATQESPADPGTTHTTAPEPSANPEPSASPETTPDPGTTAPEASSNPETPSNPENPANPASPEQPTGWGDTDVTSDPQSTEEDDNGQPVDQTGTDTETQESPAVTYPAQVFEDKTSLLHVLVRTDEGTFPEGTVMHLSAVPRQKAIEAAQEAIDRDPDRDEEVVDVLAVDITFYNEEHEELQPAVENGVHVTLTALRTLKGETQDVAHMEHLLDERQKTVTTILESHETEITARVTENRDGETVAQNVTATFDAPHFSVFAIIGTNGPQAGDTVRRIYRFWAPVEGGGWHIWETHIYKNGDTMSAPSIPSYGGQFFTGWYTGDGADHDNPSYTGTHERLPEGGQITDIDESAQQDEVVDYHAHFATEVMVRLYNARFADVIDLMEGEPGDRISLAGPEPQLTSSQRHVGWLAVNSAGEPVAAIGDETPLSGVSAQDLFTAQGVFTGSLTDARLAIFAPDDTITLGTKKIYLRALIRESDKLEFYENVRDTDPTVADYTEPVYVLQGNTAASVMPAPPKRAGYTFDGWYLDEACERPFSETQVVHTAYASDIEENILKLYAKWTPATAGYDVYIWREVLINGDPAKSEYELVVTYSGRYSGMPGDYASWDQQKITAFQNSADATSDREDTDAFDYRYYDLNETKSADVMIRGDGSTILQVYYDLKTFRMTFSSRGSTSGGTTVTGVRITDPSNTSNVSSNDLSFDVKLGQSLAGVWPTTVQAPSSGTYRNYMFYA